MGEQSPGNLGTMFDRQPLHRRGERQMHQPRLVLPGHPNQFPHRRRVVGILGTGPRSDDRIERPEVGQQTDRPHPHVFVRIMQQRSQFLPGHLAGLIPAPQLRQRAVARPDSTASGRFAWRRPPWPRRSGCERCDHSSGARRTVHDTRRCRSSRSRTPVRPVRSKGRVHERRDRPR